MEHARTSSVGDAGVKLNLGCGSTLVPGYVNVDKYGSPDVRHDLEEFPWPWGDDSVSEVRLIHVLEHLGTTPAKFLGVLDELYRVCRHGARLYIAVPHPRHDFFINDPTHVRAITPDTIRLSSKTLNRQWAKDGNANSPLGLHVDVDFELRDAEYLADEPYSQQLKDGKITKEDLFAAAERYNNVFFEIRMIVEVVKETEGA